MVTALAAYMSRESIGDAAFAEAIGCDRSYVNKLRRGVVRPTLDLAGVIEAKTHGAVPMQAWIDSSAAPAPAHLEAAR